MPYSVNTISMGFPGAALAAMMDLISLKSARASWAPAITAVNQAWLW
jgi:hypothetical protein